MATPPDLDELAESLRESLGALTRRFRQTRDDSELSFGEGSALSRLVRGGPLTSAELARREQISPQSMGTTLRGLQERGLIVREPDPGDGRRVLLTASPAGHAVYARRTDKRIRQLVRALDDRFDDDELAQLAAASPLLQRLAEGL